MRIALVLALSCGALAGCTTLKVNRFSQQTDDRRGIAYFLPFTQFETEILWSASCDKDTEEFGLAPKVQVTPKTAPDPNGAYLIDYRSLSAFTKTSNVKVDFFDSGAIKSINASADDKTGEIVTSSLVAAGKVAKAMFFGASGVTKCSGDLKDALERVGDQKKLVDAKTLALKKATSDLEALAARLVREGSSVTDAMRKRYSDQIGEVTALQMELDSLTRELAERQKKVTHKAIVTFPEVSSQWQSAKGERIPEKTLKGWLAEGDKPKAEQIATDFAIWLELNAAGAFSSMSAGDTGKPSDGIRYRVAVPGKLSVCRAALCSASDSTRPAPIPNGPDIGESTQVQAALVKEFPVKILQQGTTFFLPFESEAFTNAALTATFSEAGVMTSAGYEQKRAQGEALASVGGSLADQFTTLVEAAREKAEKEAEKAAKAEEEASPANQTLEALAADTALKQAKLANTNADIALREAEKKLAEAGL